MDRTPEFRKLFNESRSKDIVTFFDKFEAWCGEQGHDDDSMTTTLIRCLNKPTQQIYQDLMELVPQSYQAIKEDLITSHTGPKTDAGKWKKPPEDNGGSPPNNSSIMKRATLTPPPDPKSL